MTFIFAGKTPSCHNKVLVRVSLSLIERRIHATWQLYSPYTTLSVTAKLWEALWEEDTRQHEHLQAGKVAAVAVARSSSGDCETQREENPSSQRKRPATGCNRVSSKFVATELFLFIKPSKRDQCSSLLCILGKTLFRTEGVWGIS